MLNKFKTMLIISILIVVRIILSPLLFLIPKKKSRVLFYGIKRNYNGNLKETFEYFVENNPKLNVIYLVDSKDLTNKGTNHLYYKNLTTIFRIIRSNVVVLEDGYGIGWFYGILLYKSKKVQLWHGNGMKKIGLLDNKKRFKNFRVFIARFIGTLSRFDLVYFTSDYAYQNRKNAFLYKEYRLNGQPRNDILFTKNNNKDNNKKILYTPTWRDREGKFNYSQIIEYNKLNEFLKSNKITLYIKFHPIEYNKMDKNYSNIIVLNNNMDVYNMLQYTSVMITDYSSIYFDYLLLDKPIIFFPFDKEDYFNNQRDIVYNYEDITPGKQVFNTDELIEEIDNILVKDQDNYIEDRKRVRDLFYKYQDNKSRERASNDILELMGIKNEKV